MSKGRLHCHLPTVLRVGLGCVRHIAYAVSARICRRTPEKPNFADMRFSAAFCSSCSLQQHAFGVSSASSTEPGTFPEVEVGRGLEYAKGLTMAKAS